MYLEKKRLAKKYFVAGFMLLFCFVFYFTSCKTVPVIVDEENPDAKYLLEKELNFDEVSDPYKYIFFRLYDIKYKNFFTPANLLKFCVNLVEVTDITACHAAVGFNLNDEFYGLTSGGDHQLVQETCTDTENHKFLRKSNPDKSTQITYGMKVPEDEYYKLQRFVEGYANSTEIKYSVMKNFQIASFATKRRFFTKKENRKFGVMKYPNKKNKYEGTDEKDTKFVCSTFVAYALKENISSVAQWFEENDIDYRYVNVTDIAEIPGVVRLFTSTFSNYLIAANAFVDEYPQFEDYLDYEIEFIFEDDIEVEDIDKLVEENIIIEEAIAE